MAKCTPRPSDVIAETPWTRAQSLVPLTKRWTGIVVASVLVYTGGYFIVRLALSIQVEFVMMTSSGLSIIGWAIRKLIRIGFLLALLFRKKQRNTEQAKARRLLWFALFACESSHLESSLTTIGL
ncbi:MAG: hypothetical protein JRN20_22280 [Nitrososphaerota archaeon]|nr:hypothetical protein [Nitrososphaerota archaeon]